MRAAGYLRVSRERKGAISPETQRQEIERHCQYQGWAVLDWYEDLDWSASKHKPLEMPGFSEMVRRAEDGEYDVLVFYRVDRAVREHVADFMVVRSSLKAAGVDLAFVGREYDDSPDGEFTLDLDAILAKREARVTGKRARDMHRALAQQGKYVGGIVPYGWQRVRDPDGQQRLVLHPEHAPIRREWHELIAQGWSLQRIADDLTNKGIPTPRRGGWKACKISYMLRSPLQYGARISKDGTEHVTGRIEPLIDRETYERTLAILTARRQWPERTTPRPLRGNLVRCGNCGATMRRNASKAKTVYRCEGAFANVGARSCGKGANIREHILWGIVEPQILKKLRSARPPRRKPDGPRPDIAGLIEAETAAKDALGRLVALYAAGELSEEEWTAGRTKANERLESARRRTERARRALTAPTEKECELLEGITEEVWRELQSDEQHSVIRLLIDHIEVNPRGIPPRVRILWR